MIDSIQRTNIDYLGVKESFKNKEYLEELNSGYDIKVNNSKENEIIKETQKTEKEPLKKPEDNLKLAQVMTHNVIQNVPTQEFLRIKGN